MAAYENNFRRVILDHYFALKDKYPKYNLKQYSKESDVSYTSLMLWYRDARYNRRLAEELNREESNEFSFYEVAAL